MSIAPLSDTARAEVQALYLDHHAWLLNWLRKRLRHTEGAADLAQDTFVHLLGKPQAIGQLQTPRAWLSTVAHGLLVDKLRRQTLEQAWLQTLAHLPAAEVPSPENQLILLETLARVDALLDGLTPKVRTTFLLSRLEGLPYKDIAERLQISLSSVEKYMATAIRHCYLARR